jgi:predicted RNA polymerase sigma factor
MMRAKHAALGREADGEVAPPVDVAALDDEVGDDVLRLVLIACHPVLSREARVALTLRLVAGLSTAEIARAFLTPEPTIAQRLVRAKRSLAEAKVPFEVPRGEALRARIPPTLEVLYLVFNEGYAATAGEDWMRPALCDEAMRLGRILVGLMPGHGADGAAAEVHGLLALMELQASRTRARLGPDGAPVLLLEQDRGRWDRLLITRGLAGLARAEALGRPLGPYTLQAAIAACHARAPTAAATDWPRIVALYDALVEVTDSPVVELNRAVAVGMAFGPAEGLALVDELIDEPVLRGYHLLPAVRGELLHRLGRHAEARAAFAAAAKLTANARERAVLEARARAPGVT